MNADFTDLANGVCFYNNANQFLSEFNPLKK